MRTARATMAPQLACVAILAACSQRADTSKQDRERPPTVAMTSAASEQQKLGPSPQLSGQVISDAATEPPVAFLDGGLSDEDPGRPAVTTYLVPSDSSEDLGAKVSDEIRDAYAVAVIACISQVSLSVPYHPGVETTLVFSVEQTLKGVPPLTVTRPGGHAPERIVIDSEAPRVEVGRRYLALFTHSNRGPVLSVAAPMRSGTVAWLFLRDYSLSEITSIIDAHNSEIGAQ